MVNAKKYNISGKELGNVSIQKAIVDAEANGQMVKDYIVALRANLRQWSASTKTRSEVSHTTRKPHPQKGTGGARQGSLVSPQYRGGGRVFGPKPKFDQHVRINKKERRAAIRCLLADKIKDHKLIIIDDYGIETPKTKNIVEFLEKAGCNGRVLFVGHGNYAEIESENGSKSVSVKSTEHIPFYKSTRNIPKTQFALAKNISGYDVMLAKHIIMTEAALNEISEWLC